jgi:predicted membrane-bound spermidine synthase
MVDILNVWVACRKQKTLSDNIVIQFLLGPRLGSGRGRLCSGLLLLNTILTPCLCFAHSIYRSAYVSCALQLIGLLLSCCAAFSADSNSERVD